MDVDRRRAGSEPELTGVNGDGLPMRATQVFSFCFAVFETRRGTNANTGIIHGARRRIDALPSYPTRGVCRVQKDLFNSLLSCRFIYTISLHICAYMQVFTQSEDSYFCIFIFESSTSDKIPISVFRLIKTGGDGLGKQLGETMMSGTEA